MKHDFIDKYSILDSALHRLDPRVKLLLSFIFLILISASYNIRLFPLYLGVVLILMIVSKVPFHFYIKKLVIVTPLALIFTLFIYLSYLIDHRIDIEIAAFSRYYPVFNAIILLVLKIYLSILVITLLVSCTHFDALLWGLRKYKLPTIVTTLSKLVYTYIFVFIDELHRTLRAYKSRTPVLRVPRTRIYGNIAAGIFLRSMERSDSIYKAMISRGYSGQFPEADAHRLKYIDFIAILCFLCMLIAARLLWKI
jgi:cobalt/nickel transport system permease protein